MTSSLSVRPRYLARLLTRSSSPTARTSFQPNFNKLHPSFQQALTAIEAGIFALAPPLPLIRGWIQATILPDALAARLKDALAAISVTLRDEGYLFGRYGALRLRLVVTAILDHDFFTFPWNWTLIFTGEEMAAILSDEWLACTKDLRYVVAGDLFTTAAQWARISRRMEDNTTRWATSPSRRFNGGQPYTQSWFCTLRFYFEQTVHAMYDRTKGQLNLHRADQVLSTAASGSSSKDATRAIATTVSPSSSTRSYATSTSTPSSSLSTAATIYSSTLPTTPSTLSFLAPWAASTSTAISRTPASAAILSRALCKTTTPNPRYYHSVELTALP